MNLTNQLKFYRKKMKMNQRELAMLLGMTQPNYCDIENGKVQPNAPLIIKMCNIFNCSPNDLFGFKGLHTVVMSELDKD